MDPPYLPHHHHPRYVTYSPAPPPPAPFDPNPNFYGSRHHNHHPPPPTLPPPSQHPTYQSLRSRPPPPQPQAQHHAPYSPHHPQITHNSSFNPNPQFSDFSYRSASENGHVSRRLPEFGTRLNYWSDNRQLWAQQAPKLDRESHHPPFDGRPASPVNRYRHDFGGSSRFRGDNSDGFKLNPREGDDFGRVRYEYGVPDRSSGDFGVGLSPYELGLGNGNDRYNSSFDHEVIRRSATDKMRENVRWVHDRRALSGNEINNRDALRISSRKLDYHDSEVEMYDNRVRGEGSYEFNRTPRKQIQKKSALLRIQMAKPNHRSREDERSLYSGYFSEMKPIFPREKDQFVQSDNRTEVKEREGTPVELDVCFKSNALVAKAITPPSSSTVASDASLTPKNSKIRKVMVVDKVTSIATPVDSDMSLTPRNSKIRKLMEIDKDSSSSPLKVNEATTSLDGSAVAHNIQCSEKNSKQSEGKATSSGACTLENRPTKPCSKGIKFSLKKRKIKISQKSNALSDVSSSGKNDCSVSNKDLNESEKRDLSSCIHDSEIKGGAQPNSSAFNAALKESKVEGPPKGILSEKVDANLGKTPPKSSISHTVDAIPGRTYPKSTILDKVAANPGRKRTISDKVCGNPGKRPPKSTNLDKVSTKSGKTSPSIINLDKVDANPSKTSTESTISDRFATNPVKTSPKNIISDEVDANPGKTSSVKVVKKKKVVKKVANQPLCLPNVKVAQNYDKSVCVYSSPQSLPATVPDKSVIPVKKRTSSAVGSHEGAVHYVNLHQHPKATTLLLDNKEEDGPLKGMVLEEVGSDVNFDGYPESMIRKRRKMSQSVGSLSNREGKMHDSLMNVDNSICRLQTISPIESGLAKALTETISSGSVSVQVGIMQRGLSVIDTNSGMLKSEEKEVHDRILGMTSSYDTVSVSASFDLCLSNSQTIESHCVSDLDLSNTKHIKKVHENSTVDATNKHASIDLGTQVIDTVNTEEFPEIMTSQLSFEETGVSCGSLHEDCTNYGAGTMVTPEIGSIKPDDSFGPLSAYGLVILDENSGKTVSSNPVALVEDQEEDAHIDKNRKRKIEISESEIVPSSPFAGVCLSSVNETNKRVDMNISLSHENFLPTDKVRIFNGSSPIETFFEARTLVGNGVNVCAVDGLLENEKRKLSTSSSSPTKFVISEVPAVGQISEADAQPPTISNGDLLHTYQHVKVSIDARKMQATEDQPIGCVDATKCRTASELQYTGLDERLPSTKNCDGHHPLKDHLTSLSQSLGFVAHGNSISPTSTVDRLTPASDILSDQGSPVNNDAFLICTLTGKESPRKNLEGNICGDEKIPNQKPKIDGSYNASAAMSYSHCAKKKPRLLPSQVPKYTSHLVNLTPGQMRGSRNQVSHPVPKSYPGRIVFAAARNMTSSTSIPQSRTWHRTSNSSLSLSSSKPSLNSAPLQTQMPNKVAKDETSYVRKGNSLVRKATSVPALHQEFHSSSSPVYQLNSAGLNNAGKVSGSENRADVLDSGVSLRIVGVDAPLGRTRTPAIPVEVTVTNHRNDSSSNSSSSLITETPLHVLSESRADPSSSVEINDVIESSKNELSTCGTMRESSSVSNLESLNEQNEGNIISSNVKRMAYVKPRSNQLVVTSDRSCASAHIAENNKSCQSDGYYKRRKNQLIRTGTEGHVKQSINIPGSKLNAAGQMASGAYGKRQTHKVTGKTHKLSKFSLVWTLKNALLSNDGGQPCRYPKIFPQLVPWKRVAYWRGMLSSSYSRNSNLSSISHKLLFLRKRKTVYTRSSNGFSLRKSKVISVGGASLKWSKSIERRSKKASEEATMAVAKVERKRREQNGSACSIPMAESRGHSSCRAVHVTQLHQGERIFRIGSMRYKMDSSRRTLQRISDEEVTCSTGLPSGNRGNKSYVPRRLVIGNDEYVRIGNGNQLIRDPKKRTRVLASEKVRWSLHTARQRLVKKRKYCQFFTRFGKCNKDDGKCPYIHDPSKIAVCTKFLKGLCSNPNCKLTHKVIPERMPDCSYFLQGLCTNEICPYRHVHVNPNAFTCEGFLRGYCADGNECRKKHSYVCPAFEATGSCPQGSKCKLHHPKNRSKEKRKKRSREHKNARVRYFGSVHTDISEPVKMAWEGHGTEDKGGSMVEGELCDYISLDMGDEEDEEKREAGIEQATFGEDDSFDLQSEDLDELIRPVRIMDKSWLA